MSSYLATSGKSTSADDEWSFARENLQQCLIGGVEDLVAEEIVNVVLLYTIDVGGVGSNSMDAKCTVHVLEHIRRIVNVAYTWCNGRNEIGCGRATWWCCFCNS